MDFTVIGARIRILRKSNKLTQQQLSEQVGINEKYLSNIETGADNCSLAILVALANIFDTSMDYLLADNLTYNEHNHQNECYDRLLCEIKPLTGKQQRYLLSCIDLIKRYDSEDKSAAE